MGKHKPTFTPLPGNPPPHTHTQLGDDGDVSANAITARCFVYHRHRLPLAVAVWCFCLVFFLEMMLPTIPLFVCVLISPNHFSHAPDIVSNSNRNLISIQEIKYVQMRRYTHSIYSTHIIYNRKHKVYASDRHINLVMITKGQTIDDVLILCFDIFFFFVLFLFFVLQLYNREVDQF